jgi:ABC-2 type transport system ATP-binding protein
LPLKLLGYRGCRGVLAPSTRTFVSALPAEDTRASSGVPALEACGLSKRFGPVVAADRVDLRVEPGTVCGLLGPNGAGKTTLLRLLLGLVRPDAGRIEFFGRQPAPAAGLDGVAGFVEEPRFYPYLSARQTLALLARLDGGGAQRRIDELLDVVGLGQKAADRRVGGYSTGMRQRLGLAAALLASPRLLLLDEPTTGLDPTGAAEMRALVLRLAESGVAVLLSSHDMGAVADICATVTVLLSGRVVWDGTMERLQAEAPAAEYRLETSDDAAALAQSSSHPGVRANQDAERGLLVAAEHDALDRFVLGLAAEGIAVRRLTEVASSVEAMFIALTEGTAR